MNYDRRNDLIRRVAGAILISVASERELGLIAGALEADDEFMHDVAEVLRTALEASHTPPPKSVSSEKPTLDPLADTAFQAVQQQKITKARLIEEISSILSIVDTSLMKRMSTRELLRKFFADAGPSQMAKFLSRIGVSTSQDPYLRGIGNR